MKNIPRTNNAILPLSKSMLDVLQDCYTQYSRSTLPPNSHFIPYAQSVLPLASLYRVEGDRISGW